MCDELTPSMGGELLCEGQVTGSRKTTVQNQSRIPNIRGTSWELLLKNAGTLEVYWEMVEKKKLILDSKYIKKMLSEYGK